MDKKRKKKNFNKRKLLIITIIIIVLIGILFLINKLIPIKDINEDNIKVNLSTTKPTGNNITANISSKTNYDIFYYIDYTAGEEQYYENEDFSEEIEDYDDDETVNNSTNTTNSINNAVSNKISNNTTNNLNNEIDNNVYNEISNTTNTESKNTSKSKKSEEKLNIKQINNKDYKKVKDSKFEIENNGIVYLKYGRFGKLSSTPYVFEVSNIDKEGPEIGQLETSSTSTSITVTANAIDETSSNLQYYFRLSSSNTYISTGSKNTYTFTELTTDENYTIYVKAVDKFGNESEAVTEAVASVEQNVVEKKIYHFKVNVAANTVTVYEKDENGKFTKPLKAFVCSTGKATPKSGTYKISIRYRWRSLFGGVFGQYAVRIHGNILFHSVPYEKMYPNTLEYDEYDKLGTSASAGCVRLSVKDAKWIYDNAKSGSTVQFYSDASNPGPLGKPKAQKISNNKANRNWDPTDPDKHNPWLGGDGTVTKIKVNDDTSNTKINNSRNTTTTNNSTNNTLQNNETNTIIWDSRD